MLERFTERDLEIWEARTADLQSYYDRAYFDLERQRASHYDDLCATLREVPAISIPVNGWVRVTDYRWSLTPLSATGSLNGIGGRFNIGSDIDRARGQEFPCLYIASNIETAFREYFGGPTDSHKCKLTLSELTLRRRSSFTTFSLHGQIEHALDLSRSVVLGAFAKIIATFDHTRDTKSFAHRLRLSPQRLIRTPGALWNRLLCSPAAWRLDPQAFGIPASSQIFGRFVRDAGFEAILYPSQRGGQDCLAIFPQNLHSSSTRVEVSGSTPAGASCTLLDKDHMGL